MIYAYTILLISTFISVVAVAYIVISASRPDPSITEGADGSFYMHTVATRVGQGENVYYLEYTRATSGALWFVVIGTGVFALSMLFLCFRSVSLGHTAIRFPVERLEQKMIVLVEDRRSMLLGNTWFEDEKFRQFNLLLEPDGDGWQIEICGELPDIREDFVQPTGPFAACEQLEPRIPDDSFPSYRVYTTDLIDGCNWIVREYLKYPEGVEVELSVTDGEVFTWRPSAVKG